MSGTGQRPRIAFVGNCQAQSLESLCGHLGVPVEVVQVPPVFDIGAFGRPEVWERLKSCDHVFNQRVAADYPVEFARPGFLRAELGARAVSWPNIYFDGYFPGIEYVYTTSGKVVGPLSDYHFRFVRSAWASGLRVDLLEADFLEGPLSRSFAAAADASLYQLRLRESGLDVRMSDAVCARWRYHKTLFTMNHPDNALLHELLRRLLARAGVVVPSDVERLASYPYTLNEIMIPAFPALHRIHGIGFPLEERIRGKAMAEVDGRWVMQPAAHDYTWRQLFEAYYRLYDDESRASPETAAILRNAVPA